MISLQDKLWCYAFKPARVVLIAAVPPWHPTACTQVLSASYRMCNVVGPSERPGIDSLVLVTGGALT